MPSIYAFLFFLQKQNLYFQFQDSVLEILTLNSDLTYDQLVRRIKSLNSQLASDTIEALESGPYPFTDTSFFRIKFGDSDYPKEFYCLSDPPLVFSFLGEKVWLKEKIAIVGSRLPSQKSLWWLSKELNKVLIRDRLVSVSGGALGVDQLVHQASIDLKLPTIAILPSGLKNIYPKSFASMVPVVLKNGGCLISEFADTQVVMKYHFSYRNRLIAALGKLVVIVEAREKSGSLITAHRALEMGKDIFVIPGHPLDENFRGSLQLLKMGAHIITEAIDLDYWC